MRICLYFLALVCTYTSALIAQSTPPYSLEENWEKVCRQAKQQPLKAPVFTGPLSFISLAKCDETALYYGFGTNPDYPAALQCGWYERAHPQPSNANMFYGPGVLAMLYANGLAVPQDYRLAIRFACEDPWTADAEMEGRIGHLEYLQKVRLANKPTAAPFDLCDDVTSGMNDGACTVVQMNFADATRAKKLLPLVANLPPETRADLPQLQAAEKIFEDARSYNEIDLSGTLRTSFMYNEKTKLRDQFLINLQRFGQGDIPPTDGIELDKLNQQMTTVYQHILLLPQSTWQDQTVNPKGIRATQQSWLALQDAWLRFSAVAYPQLSPVSVRAQLVRLRLHQLRSILAQQ